MDEAASDVAIIGLPGSGKTTLLAAVWHMVREKGASTSLTFAGLSQGNYEHLNSLAKRWRSGKRQQRTQLAGTRSVSMRLSDGAGRIVEVSFPDSPGEEFSRMWERRELDEMMRATLLAPAIVLVVNGDMIRFPVWIAEQNEIQARIGLAPEAAEAVDWRAELAPTQVQVVELLQFLMSGTLDVGARKLAVLITAWDVVEGEGMEPEEVLSVHLPLLDQYLRNARDPWTWRVWGLSAQGGVYEDADSNEVLPETEALRELDRPSDRIKVTDGKDVSTDITAPLDWLIR
ncbi:hypothetical protein JAK53_00075 [Stenotrophomonas maltophilia]|uniref:TRAFAC clade GTPase domain-containing protein n=1 Tax=Stenotrophomonas maltophilia TaxID=40324 RepID=UPI0018D477D9|nr:hypothetical protein [Stenotrophomonas maltophilia]MBH1817149.1 hypothetical protein [Stenotrophomonas maltophilia]MCU1027663.1 hypothetical protein [Stenotrophomonas maltophilia]